MRILRRLTVPAALSLAAITSVARAEIIDPTGDFLPSFAGPASAELDVVRANASYDGTSFVLSSVEAGLISTTSNALFVWGFDRDAGTARFGASAPGVLFDSVVAINPTAGTVTVNDLVGGRPAASLGSGAFQVSGTGLSVTVPAALLPSQGLLPDAYLVNLWPRTGAGNNNQIADFAPDNSDFQVTRVAAAPVPVPEPASAALLATGLLGLFAVRMAEAFRVLGGVPRRGIFDNMRTAVDRVGTGKVRQVNARFQAMASHYLFEPTFCSPASGWEKGQVEKNVQDARRQIWQVMPSFGDLPALNAWLEARCIIAEVDARMRRLKALRAELERMASNCMGGHVDECRITETLADFGHGHCSNSAHNKSARRLA